jgi:hypothetical protein
LKEATNTSPCTDKTKPGLASSSSSSSLAPSSPHRSLFMSSSSSGVMDSPAAMAAASLLSGSKESMPVVDAAKITVAIRVRPLTEDEERVERVMSQGVVVDGTQIQVNGKDGRPQRTFAFDHCFDSTYAGSKTGSQEHMFETIGRKVLTDAWEGFNTCVFACTYFLFSPLPPSTSPLSSESAKQQSTYSPSLPPSLRWPNRLRQDAHHARWGQARRGRVAPPHWS